MNTFKLLEGGKIQVCQHTTPAPNSQNGAQLHGSKTGNRDSPKKPFPESPISPSKPRPCGRTYLNTVKSHQHGKTHENPLLKKGRPAHFSDRHRKGGLAERDIPNVSCCGLANACGEHGYSPHARAFAVSGFANTVVETHTATDKTETARAYCTVLGGGAVGVTAWIPPFALVAPCKTFPKEYLCRI